jgi:hypothetical protein
MASVIDDPNGRKRILFAGADRKRHAIRLGKASVKQADAFKVKVRWSSWFPRQSWRIRPTMKRAAGLPLLTTRCTPASRPWVWRDPDNRAGQRFGNFSTLSLRT